MGRRLLSAGTVGLACAAVGACGGTAPTPLAEECTAPPAVRAALVTAPEPVLLADGTTLAQCIADGQDDGELQEVGIAFSRAAEALAEAGEMDPTAALQLGYLVGVTRKGAARTNGVMLELVRRVEVTAGRMDTTPASEKALADGLAAGEAQG